MGVLHMPVRAIPRNYLSVTGRVPSSKTDDGRLASYESTLERDYLLRLEFDLSVTRYEEQPCEIIYKHPILGTRTYVPDVHVEYSQDPVRGGPRRDEIVELKFRSELKERWADLRPRYRAAVHYCRERNWRFVIRTEVEVRTPYLTNILFLRRYRDLPANAEREALILNTLGQLRETNPQALMAAVFDNRDNQAMLVPFLWRLVANRLIGMDWSQPLNMRSRIWSMVP